MVIITIPGACVSFSYTCWWCWFVFMFSSLPMYLTNNFCVLYIMEKETATHSSILAWKIPWTEEPGRLQFMLSPRIGHDRVTSLSFLYIKIYKIFNIYINNLSSRRTIFFFQKEVYFASSQNISNHNYRVSDNSELRTITAFGIRIYIAGDLPASPLWPRISYFLLYMLCAWILELL